MFSTRTRSIAMMLAFALPLQPAVAMPFLSQNQGQNQGLVAGEVLALTAIAMPEPRELQSMPLPCSSFMPVMLVPIGAVPASALAVQRDTIARRLRDLGYKSSVAQQMASELTPEELAVLLANPKMMQKAGEMDELTKNVIWALVIAGVVVAIVIAADGSININ